MEELSDDECLRIVAEIVEAAAACEAAARREAAPAHSAQDQAEASASDVTPGPPAPVATPAAPGPARTQSALAPECLRPASLDEARDGDAPLPDPSPGARPTLLQHGGDLPADLRQPVPPQAPSPRGGEPLTLAAAERRGDGGAEGVGRVSSRLDEAKALVRDETRAPRETRAGGDRRTAGVGAGIPGHGGDRILLDDPIKSRKLHQSKDDE